MRLNTIQNQPSTAYIMATWITFGIGAVCYLIGIFNSELELNEKGFYLTVFLFGLFSAISLQKNVRDKEEGIPVTNIFMGICWFSFGSAIALLCIGLFNAEMLLSEKGFFGISFLMSLFTVITLQKNIRDMTDEEGNVLPEAFPKSADTVTDLIEEATDKL